nr:uncharacterized protein CTRU02_15131 [Colletotrichum truncatum]KAF6781424.1 hypothetical protein CTRU02_15131 [Colletotrichum truncatum]
MAGQHHYFFIDTFSDLESVFCGHISHLEHGLCESSISWLVPTSGQSYNALKREIQQLLVIERLYRLFKGH